VLASLGERYHVVKVHGRERYVVLAQVATAPIPVVYDPPLYVFHERGLLLGTAFLALVGHVFRVSLPELRRSSALCLPVSPVPVSAGFSQDDLDP
jgi:hypothetical protein